jgi:AcrR family transcriptional regulator
MTDPLAAPGESRQSRKERTRRAILDATLARADETSLAMVSLRQVARDVGIVPTGFYRHFDSIDEVGLALVDEAFTSLRQMLRDVRRGNPALEGVIRSSVSILVDHAHRQRISRGCPTLSRGPPRTCGSWRTSSSRRWCRRLRR